GKPSGSHVTSGSLVFAIVSARGPCNGFAASKNCCPHGVIGGTGSFFGTAPVPNQTPLMSRLGAGAAGFLAGGGVVARCWAWAGEATIEATTNALKMATQFFISGLLPWFWLKNG